MRIVALLMTPMPMLAFLSRSSANWGKGGAQ